MKSFVLLGVLAFSFCLYLIAIPFLPAISFVDIANSCQMTYLKDYYSTVAPVVAFFISVIGILFGVYYYHNKNEIEDRRNLCLRLNKFFDVTLSKVDSVGVSINDLLHQTDEDFGALKTAISHVYHDCDSIETVLEIGSRKYGWLSSEYSDILAYRSFATKICDRIDKDGCLFFDDDELKLAKQKHRDMLNAARRACYDKIEDIYSERKLNNPSFYTFCCVIYSRARSCVVRGE
jgi:hypothetical protein